MLDCLVNIPNLSGIFDTHSHYEDEKFENIREELLSGLFALDLEGIITCGCDIPSSKAAIELSQKFPKIYAAVGFHPENLPETEPDLKELEALLKHNKVVALGEIGLDYHWDVPRDRQHKWFKAQLELAKALNIPTIIHDREAHGDTLEFLTKYKPKGVLHCFSGSSEMAKQVLNLGLYIGVGGVVTFKNARKTLEVVKALPLDRLLLETDCPYLAPEPFRGKLCHSGHIAFTAEKIAEIKGITAEDVINQSLENAKRLFLE